MELQQWQIEDDFNSLIEDIEYEIGIDEMYEDFDKPFPITQKDLKAFLKRAHIRGMELSNKKPL